MNATQPTTTKPSYQVDYQGEYIEVKVFGPRGNLRNKTALTQ